MVFTSRCQTTTQRSDTRISNLVTLNSYCRASAVVSFLSGANFV